MPAASAAGLPAGLPVGCGSVARLVVDVMLKAEILDPQGQAIARALPDLGFAGVRAVRQGKRFEVDLDADGDAALELGQRIAATLLANPVLEDFTVRRDG